MDNSNVKYRSFILSNVLINKVGENSDTKEGKLIIKTLWRSKSANNSVLLYNLFLLQISFLIILSL